MYAAYLAAAALLLAAAPCSAQSDMVVRVRDLDLASRSGAAIALQRMDAAARTFCSANAQQLDYTVSFCRRDMTGRAVGKLNAARVSHLYMASSARFQMAMR